MVIIKIMKHKNELFNWKTKTQIKKKMFIFLISNSSIFHFHLVAFVYFKYKRDKT